MQHFFETSRLIARRFTALDLDAFVAMRADPEVARFQSWENFTEQDGRAFLEPSLHSAIRATRDGFSSRWSARRISSSSAIAA